MRRNHLPWLALLLLSVFTYIACQKEYKPGFPLDPVNPPSEKVTTSISGRVINERQEPVEGATVTAGNVNTTTNHNGYFNLENASVVADAAFIKVNMQGYFLGSRTIMAQEDGAHYVQIELIPIEKAGEFAAATGGTVSFPQGGSAIFPAGAIIRAANGSAYTGRVDVNQFFIDPTADGFTDRMPGDLKGITTGNDVVAMQSFGMMAILLNGESGEQLQVAPGKMVDLHFPIPAGLVSKAPATIPLWFFDEEKGLWREEGSATKTGTEYIGQVSHFSFWNCDVPLQFTELSFMLKDQGGNPQTNLQVQIKKKSDNTIANGFTDAEGRADGWVPAGEALEMSVFDACNTLLHKRDIGPFTSKTDLGVVTIDAGTTVSYILNNASFLNCADEHISNGFVGVYFRGKNIRMSLDGKPMSIGFSHCEGQADSAQVTVYDADREMFTVKSVWIQPGTNDVGTIRLCEGGLSQFVKFTISGSSFEFTSPADSVMAFLLAQEHHVDFFSLTGTANGKFWFPANLSYPESYSTILRGFSLVSDTMLYVYRSNGNVEVQKYGLANEFIEGTFTATLTDSLRGFTVPMNGSFRFRRQ